MNIIVEQKGLETPKLRVYYIVGVQLMNELNEIKSTENEDIKRLAYRYQGPLLSQKATCCLARCWTSYCHLPGGPGVTGTSEG